MFVLKLFDRDLHQSDLQLSDLYGPACAEAFRFETGDHVSHENATPDQQFDAMALSESPKRRTGETGHGSRDRKRHGSLLKFQECLFGIWPKHRHLAGGWIEWNRLRISI